MKNKSSKAWWISALIGFIIMFIILWSIVNWNYSNFLLALSLPISIFYALAGFLWSRKHPIWAWIIYIATPIIEITALGIFIGYMLRGLS